MRRTEKEILNKQVNDLIGQLKHVSEYIKQQQVERNEKEIVNKVKGNVHDLYKGHPTKH